MVLALTWLAERRAAVRPVLALIPSVLGAVTLLHAFALTHVWSGLLG